MNYEILVEPVKTMIEKACQAASEMIEKHTGEKTQIEILELKLDDVITLYLKYNGEIMFKHIWQLSAESDLIDARIMIYGTLITEMLTTFCIVASQTRKTLSKGV